MRFMFILPLAATLAGCISALSHGVTQSADGTYVVTALTNEFRANEKETIGSAMAKTIVYDEAREFCAAKGAQMYLVDAKRAGANPKTAAIPASTLSGGSVGAASVQDAATLRFTCAK
ncbi:MAG: hypothetical protein ACKVQK_17600 [Burkholderiales bacterium]